MLTQTTKATARVATAVAQLETCGVVVRFVGVHALDSVDLTVRQGDLLGLIGPNGAGKTTLVNVLSGFQRPTSGTVRLDGQDITRWPAHRRARAGIARTFQSVRAFRGLTVRENIDAALFASAKSTRRRASLADDVLALTGLSDLAGLPAGSLSFGQERRVGIARALAAQPRIILLDEPAAGLNEYESDELQQTLRTVHNELGCGLLIIEHDMRLVMGICERLHVLDYGCTISEGKPAAVAKDERVLEAYLGRRRGDADASG